MAQGQRHEVPLTQTDSIEKNRRFMFPVPPYYYVDELRFYIRDSAPENILLDLRSESDDDQLRRAWGRALADFNETPPRFRTPYTFQTCPAPYLLLKKAAAEAIRSVIFSYIRNELQYTDGDQNFSLNHQWKPFLELANQLNAEYEQEKHRVKYEINAQQVFGASPSEFGMRFAELGGMGDVGLTQGPSSTGV